jgi:mannose-1-phosphate guanylyltransferase
MPRKKLAVHAVILAGGRGTRFWPRSRASTPKQLLRIVGAGTMLEQTVARLRPWLPADRIWTVTNIEQQAAVRAQLPKASRRQVLVEPCGRNTAAAIALAAFHIRKRAKQDALMAVLPADHYIAEAGAYRTIVQAALRAASEPGRMVVLGVPPTRPETGFGYIEWLDATIGDRGVPVYPVRRFTEKPELQKAAEYLASGNYYWNAGMFFWRVSTILGELQQHLPATYQALEKLSTKMGSSSYASQLRRVYGKLENISVDYAILEKATRETAAQKVFVIPASVGWSDIGSWEAVYELSASSPGENVFAGRGHALDSRGNFAASNGKFVALVGVNDLVVIETGDALLICQRKRAQDVGKMVKWLEERGFTELL